MTFRSGQQNKAHLLLTQSKGRRTPREYPLIVLLTSPILCLSNELHRKHETRKFVFTEILEFETPLTREGLASPSIRCSLQRGMEKPSAVYTSVSRAASKTSHRAYIFYFSTRRGAVSRRNARPGPCSLSAYGFQVGKRHRTGCRQSTVQTPTLLPVAFARWLILYCSRPFKLSHWQSQTLFF